MRALCLAVIILRVSAANSPCSLSGEPTPDGGCACDAAWSGASCERLSLLDAPAPLAAAYPPPAWFGNTTSWGASVVKDGATGLHHMFVAEMSGECGMATWGRNSVIRHAVAAVAAIALVRRRR